MTARQIGRFGYGSQQLNRNIAPHPQIHPMCSVPCSLGRQQILNTNTEFKIRPTCRHALNKHASLHLNIAGSLYDPHFLISQIFLDAFLQHKRTTSSSINLTSVKKNKKIIKKRRPTSPRFSSDKFFSCRPGK